MAEQNQAKAAAEAPAKVAETVANTAEKLANESAKTTKRTRAATARRAKREKAAQPAPRKTRAAKPRRNTRTTARKAAAGTQERIEDVTFNGSNFFAGFNGAPAFTPFQSLFANAGDRGQQAVRRSQQLAEEFAELSRANVEALVEAGRVAAEGARTIGQDVVASSRDSVEQAADAIRTLAEAKSPTEFVQLQSELARNSFDRLVAESSRLTETLVKLAGEAIQPLSNRASANAERANSFVA
jgi:phasin family protein